jgi:polar amino acid transport system substrate-binding protein
VFAYLTGAAPVRVFAQSLHPTPATPDDLDNVVVTIAYDDGSIGNLLYLTQGGSKVPKEFLEVFGGGQTVQLHNFEHLRVFAGDGAAKIKGKGIDKGQREEMAAFVQAVKTGAEMPIAIDCLFETTLATLAAVESAKTGRAVDIAELWAAGS